MSNVMNCPMCNAVCRVLGQDAGGLPQLKAFQNDDAQNTQQKVLTGLVGQD
jgi:hypothetical protein